jgi:hypothetical protein
MTSEDQTLHAHITYSALKRRAFVPGGCHDHRSGLRGAAGSAGELS